MYSPRLVVYLGVHGLGVHSLDVHILEVHNLDVHSLVIKITQDVQLLPFNFETDNVNTLLKTALDF